jgi:hypothetical protein
VTWGPEEERAHPRDTEGRWTDRLDARLRRLPDFPADGQKMQASEMAYRKRWLDEHGRYSGLEIWHPNQGTWMDAADAFPKGRSYGPADEDDPMKGIKLDDPYGIGLTMHWTPSAPIHVRRRLEPARRVDQTREKPSPRMEYLHEETGVWMPGSRIDVDPDTGMWDAFGSPFGSGKVAERPHYPPTNFDDRPAAYGFTPEDHAFNGMIRTIYLQDVVDQPSYLQGGYQMRGEDGQWHTLEEVYQAYPELEDSDLFELIAGDLHFPEIEASSELTVRRTPMDY